MALGLHLRNEDPSLSNAKKEPLALTWWCLHSIECLVSSITGRPPVISGENCTVSLPKAEDPTTDTNEVGARQSTRRRTDHDPALLDPVALDPVAEASRAPTKVIDSQYFLDHIKVTLIAQRVLLSLYSPKTAAQNWVVCMISFIARASVSAHEPDTGLMVGSG